MSIGMGGEDGAGQSAAQRAAAMRAKAARLTAAADRWDQGARGEQATARVLNPLSGDGWHVLHDVAIPGSAANIDHIVVGPPGVVVVDSKNWTGRVHAADATLWVGRYPKRRELATLEWELAQVRSVLEAALPGWPVPVGAVICLTSATLAEPVLRAGEISATGPADLVRHLAHRRVVFAPWQVDAIAERLDAGLGSRTGRPSAVVRPEPLPPLPSPVPSPRLRRPSARSRSTTPSAPRSVPVPSTTRRTRRRPARVAKAIGIGFGVLVALSVLNHLVAPPATPSRLAAASTATATGPAPLSFTWMCPAPGAGWTAQLAWPPGRTPAATWSVRTAPGAAGPWTYRQNGAGAVPSPRADHLLGGTLLWVQAGPVAGLAAGQPLTAGQVLTPPGC